jgi:hypothetical protein
MDPAGWPLASRVLIGPTMSKLAALAVVLAASTAHAGNPLEDGWVGGRTPSDPPVEIQEAPELKSATIATVISAAGTLAGGALFLASWNTDDSTLFALGTGALMLGPSAGHWYAGQALTWGLPVRLAGAGLAVAGAMAYAGCTTVSLGEDDCNSQGLIIGGLATIGAGALIDIATAGRSARAYNERHWQLAPTMVSDGQARAMGFGLSGSF